MSLIVMKSMAHLIGHFDLVAARYGIAFVVMFALLLATRQSLRFPPFWLTMGMALFQTTAFQCLAPFALITGGAGIVVTIGGASWRARGRQYGVTSVVQGVRKKK